MRKKYKVAALLWQDHTMFNRSPMKKNFDDAIRPTLSIGIIYKETPRYYVLVSQIERHEHGDESDYMVIFKPVLAVEEYGEIQISKLRVEE